MYILKLPRLTVLLFTISLFLLACGKSSDLKPDKGNDDEGNDINVPFYKLQRVENFYAEITSGSPTTPSPTVFFSLENKKATPLTYVKTNRWDISFGGLYSSFMAGNNGKDSQNDGYQSTGVGGITVVEKAFDEVTDVPDDQVFKTRRALIGTDNAGAFGEGTGWYLYDFSGQLVRNGAYDNQHIAYALGAGLSLSDGTKVSPRTIIVKTAKGNYAKVKMISCYKDAFTIDKWFRNTPHMYFTFEYVIVPSGSKKFEIR